MKLTKSPIEGFYLIPGYEHLAISEKGQVFDIRASCFYEEARGNYEYPAINALGIGTLHVHRLLGLTFLDCPSDFNVMEINHKDGNKRNYSLNNLEWVTVAENITHAYMTGLRTDNKPVLLKNLLSGSIERFYSLNECARFFNVNSEKISRYIRNRDLYPFMGRFELIFEGQDWRGLTEADVGKLRPGQPQSVVALKEDENKLYVFNSIQAAAEYIGISSGTIVTRMYGNKKKSVNGYLLWPLRGFKENLDNSIYIEKKIPEPKPPRRKPIPVDVTNTNIGETTRWDSVEVFANSIGVSKNTIQKSILINNGRWKYYHITYVPSISND